MIHALICFFFFLRRFRHDFRYFSIVFAIADTRYVYDVDDADAFSLFRYFIATLLMPL